MSSFSPPRDTNSGDEGDEEDADPLSFSQDSLVALPPRSMSLSRSRSPSPPAAGAAGGVDGRSLLGAAAARPSLFSPSSYSASSSLSQMSGDTPPPPWTCLRAALVFIVNECVAALGVLGDDFFDFTPHFPFPSSDARQITFHDPLIVAMTDLVHNTISERACALYVSGALTRLYVDAIEADSKHWFQRFEVELGPPSALFRAACAPLVDETLRDAAALVAAAAAPAEADTPDSLHHEPVIDRGAWWDAVKCAMEATQMVAFSESPVCGMNQHKFSWRLAWATSPAGELAVARDLVKLQAITTDDPAVPAVVSDVFAVDVDDGGFWPTIHCVARARAPSVEVALSSSEMELVAAERAARDPGRFGQLDPSSDEEQLSSADDEEQGFSPLSADAYSSDDSPPLEIRYPDRPTLRERPLPPPAAAAAAGAHALSLSPTEPGDDRYFGSNDELDDSDEITVVPGTP